MHAQGYKGLMEENRSIIVFVTAVIVIAAVYAFLTG